MKKLLLLPLLLSLSACVTYYYPEGVEESSAYYIEDAPGYVTNLSSNVDYYPWASLDTFYLGSGYYPGYGYGGGGFSFGVSIGYSPWYYPYDSYYSPWYGSYYSHNYQPYYPYYYRPHYSGWWPHQGYCERTHACDHRGNRHHHDANGGRTGDHGEAPVRRYVSTAPSGSAGNRGLVVRNRGNSKPGKSHIEPVYLAPGREVSTPGTSRHPQRRPATTVKPGRAITPIERTRRSGGEIRYRGGAKPGRSRTEPVKLTAPARAVGNRVSTPVSRPPPRSATRPPSNSVGKVYASKSGHAYPRMQTTGDRPARHKSRSAKDSHR